MTLGKKIRAARIERGLTQKQLVGDHITRNMLSKIENDSATPSVRTLEYIAGKLELPVGYFLGDSQYSDGTSPDGLDEMRAAYKAGRYAACMDMLERAKTAGTTDEGYLLHAKAALAAAREALRLGDHISAKSYADTADYYNKESLYYSAEVDAEMSLILAECALVLDISEFEENAAEYERSIREISFEDRFVLARAEFLLRTGELELADTLLSALDTVAPELQAKFLYLRGRLQVETGGGAALELLSKAEALAEDDGRLSREIYAHLEKLYLDAEDFKMAHYYAAKQLREVPDTI